MTELDQFRKRLYATYASSHAGIADAESGIFEFERDIQPHLPRGRNAIVVDIGCGQGRLVKQLVLHGYKNARGIDASPEQVAVAHAHGIMQVVLGDFRSEFNGSTLDAVIATDFFEHLTKGENLEALDRVYDALRPGAVLILRVPNSVSPFAGNYRYGDITHETSFTARSLRQLGAAAGFTSVAVFACAPAVHGAKSLARSILWRVASGAMKLSLVSETGAVRGHLVTQNIVAVMQKLP